eukprot:112655-Chlamydomonas_euryale.AAC.1
MLGAHAREPCGRRSAASAVHLMFQALRAGSCIDCSTRSRRDGTAQGVGWCGMRLSVIAQFKVKAVCLARHSRMVHTRIRGSVILTRHDGR